MTKVKKVRKAKDLRNAPKRDFAFTLNNYTDAEIALLRASPHVRYCIFGKEVCPTTGTPHLQGYLQLRSLKQVVPATAAKIIGLTRAHFESIIKSEWSNVKYSSKDGNVTEWGTRIGQGHRSDLANVLDHIKTVGTVAPLFELYNYQAIRFAELACTYHESGRDWLPVVFWFYGPAGAGKTQTAIAEARKMYGSDAYFHTGIKWWPGYDHHPHVIIDELRRDKFPWEYPLQLLDTTPVRVEIKGGYRQFVPRHIWITAPVTPDHMFDGISEDVGQLRRRISEVREFQKKPE